ncbi:MAG: SIS domain-containing protein [Sporichthyaceae bacterium]
MIDLDDARAIAAGDPADMLGAVTSGGTQLREGVAAAADGPLPAVPSGGFRSLTVVGMGGSAAAADVLATVVAARGALPVSVLRGYELPGWIGPADLVVAVSCTGATTETLSAVADGARRGAVLVGVGADGSPLAAAFGEFGGPWHGVDAAGRQPRSCLWSLAAPLLVLADALGLADVDAWAIAEAADVLDEVAARCAAPVPSSANEGKALALQLAGALPMVWGFSAPAAAAATRFGGQLAENAKVPAVVGLGSEPHHNQVVAFDGPLAGAGVGGVALRPVLLRDSVEAPWMGRRARETGRLAAEAGLATIEVAARGEHPLVRLASLTGLLDFASVYLAVRAGIDPTPVGPIVTLKDRMSRAEGKFA